MMCKLNINSTFAEARRASALLQLFCSQHSINVETQGHLELILIEALNNVVEHAYEGKPGNNILIEYERIDTNTVIKITDAGIPTPEALIIEDSSLPNENKLPEGGWGLCLIQDLTDTIKYYHHSDQNILVLIKGDT